MKAVLYARISSDNQIDNWSISAQIREFQDYCSKKDWKPIGIYKEDAKSAYSETINKRSEFRRLLEDSKTGHFNIVVVHSLDRWSRNLKVTLNSLSCLQENEVSFASITESIDFTTPEGRLFLAMLAAFAQYFSDNLAKHTTKGKKERAMNGLPNGDVAFSYRRYNPDNPTEKKGYIYIVPDEAEAVRKIFQFYANGGWSLSDLATWLNEKGFRTRNKRGLITGEGEIVTGARLFTLYSVRWLLHNPFFMGKIKYKGQLYNGAHTAIISEALFNSVQEKLKSARNRSKTFSRRYRLYLLKGIARCIYCGYPLWSETSNRGHSYYREPRNSRIHYNCPAIGKSINCRTIDNQIDEIVSSLVLEPAWRKKIMDKLSSLSERESILKQKKHTEEKIRRLGRAYIDGVIDEGEYNVQRRLLQDTLNTLVLPETDATINAGQLLENLSVVWTEATLEEKHRLLSSMLEVVYVDMVATRSIVGIQPKPPFYSLFNILKSNPESRVTIFTNSGQLKEKAPSRSLKNEVVMVETGESRTPRPRKAAQDILQA